LCKYGCMTQREAAMILGLKSGVAVSCQLRKLREILADDGDIRGVVAWLDRTLSAKQR